MLLEFLLAPFLSRDNIVGGTLNNIADTQASRRRSALLDYQLEQNRKDKELRFKEREVKALEIIAKNSHIKRK